MGVLTSAPAEQLELTLIGLHSALQDEARPRRHLAIATSSPHRRLITHHHRSTASPSSHRSTG
jgi:hypothetical protein